jgi:hypothetical protein
MFLHPRSQKSGRYPTIATIPVKIMSNLVNPLASIIQAASQLPTTGVAANYHQRIGTGNPNIRCLLLDTSGSMSMECKGKDRRIDVLRKAVEGSTEPTQI